MKKSNSKYQFWQQKIDAFWQTTLINFLPLWLTPNILSWLRLLSMPIILILFFYDQPFKGLLLFIFSILLDSLDGAIARTRKQFTPTGLWLDPLADKLLIIGIIIFLINISYISPILLIAIIILELFLIISSIIGKIFLKTNLRPSLLYGKLKMLLQSIAIILALIDYFIIKNYWQNDNQKIFSNVGNLVFILLLVSLIFQILAIFSYFKKIIKPIKIKK